MGGCSTGYMAVAITLPVTFAPPLISLFGSTPEVVRMDTGALRIVAP